MPLLVPGADSVMILRWGGRAKLDSGLTQAHPRDDGTSSASRRLTKTPSFFPEGSPSKEFTERKSSRFRFNSGSHVRRLPGRCAIALLTALVLISQPAMGISPFNEQNNHVIFRSQICQPVSSANLKKLMGANFDEKNMASDMATAQKMLGSTGVDPDNDGLQGDDPLGGIAKDDTGAREGDQGGESDDDMWFDQKDDDIRNNNGGTEETRIKEVSGSRTWLPRRKVLNRHVDSNGRNKTPGGDDTDYVNRDGYQYNSENKQNVGDADSYTYMKRRRRFVEDRQRRSVDDRLRLSGEDRLRRSVDSRQRRSVEDRQKRSPNHDAVSDDDTDNPVNNKRDDNKDDGDTVDKDKKPTNSILLKLVRTGKDKNLRKKLKKQLRQFPSNLSKPPPWECKFSQIALHVGSSYFPMWINDGRCETDKCFYRLYNCEPIKYTLKLLHRDPNKCNPLPSTTNLTVYEERWELVHRYITVGCNCVSPLIRNTKPKSRRRD